MPIDSLARLPPALPWLALLVASWTSFGLLLVRRVFHLQQGVEVATLALPVGLLAQLLLVNGTAYLFGPARATWMVGLAALLVSAALLPLGPRRPLEWDQPPWARGLALLLLLAASCGLLAFGLREVYPDDGAHGSMTQLLAAGQFPLRFPCNPALRASYHYGGNLLAAGVLLVTGLPVFTALDVTRVVVFDCVLLLAFLAGWRPQRSWLGGLTSAVLVATVGQARWLDAALVGSGAPTLLAGQAWSGPWMAEVQSVLQLPLGIGHPGSVPALVHAHRSLAWGFGPLQLLLALALLEAPLGRVTRSGALGLVVASTALVQVGAWILLLPALLLAWCLDRRSMAPVGPSRGFSLAVVATLALGLSLLQGGPLTDSLADRLEGLGSPTTSFQFDPVRLQACRNESPSLACALRTASDAGLAPWLLAWPACLAWRRRQDARLALLGGCLVGLVLPLLLRYGHADENIGRTLTFAVWILGALLGPPLAQWLLGTAARRIAALGLLAGLSACALAFLAAYAADERVPRVLTPHLFGLGSSDEALSPLAPRLPLGAVVFDPKACLLAAGCGGACRPALVLGRYAPSSAEWRHCAILTISFEALRANPTAELLRAGGYTHVYADAAWLDGLAPAARERFASGALELLGAVGSGPDWRGLYRVCGPAEGCASAPPLPAR